MATKSITDRVLEQLEEFKLRSVLNTEEKVNRYVSASKAGYSTHFALIFALQK